LTTRLLNTGVIPAEMVGVSWQLGSVNGEEIARTNIMSLAAGQSYEIACPWNAAGRYFPSAFVPVYAVVDPTNTVAEMDETNNSYPQSVRVVPSGTPRILSLTVPDALTAKLTVGGSSFSATKLAVEGTVSLAAPISWVPETNAVITTNLTGQLEIRLPQNGPARYYRVKGQ